MHALLLSNQKKFIKVRQHIGGGKKEHGALVLEPIWRVIYNQHLIF
jgi:hypothetical protein